MLCQSVFSKENGKPEQETSHMCLEGTLSRMRNGLGWTWEMDHGASQRKEMQILLQVIRARKRRQSVGRTLLLNVSVKKEGGLER